MKLAKMIIDVETGGLNPEENKLLTIGLIVDDDVKINTELVVKDDEELVVTDEALKINNLDINYVNTIGMSSEDVIHFLYDIKNALEVDKFIPVGWNVKFDLEFLARFLGREIYEDLFYYKCIEVSSIYYAIFKELVSLDEACDKLKIPLNKNTYHNALYDCYLTKRVKECLMKKIET